MKYQWDHERYDLKPPWASIEGRQETCLNVGPKERDANIWNSQVLDRIDFDLLGKLARKDRVWIWIGLAKRVLRRMPMIRS